MRQKTRRPALTPDAANKISAATSEHQNHRNTQRQRPQVFAAGFIAEPIGRRTEPALIVPRCPKCLCLHLHRGRGDQRTGSCGATYTVIIAGGKRARRSA